MKQYREITIVDCDISVNHILSKVMTQLHLLFTENKGFSISLPGFKMGVKARFLGNKIRVFHDCFSDEINKKLEEKLYRLDDYIYLSELKNVPTQHKFAVYKRKHLLSESEFNRKKQKSIDYVCRKTGLNLDEVSEYYNSLQLNVFNFPFFRLKSLSSGKTYLLNIEKKMVKKEGSGEFSSFGLGLSDESTVPDF